MYFTYWNFKNSQVGYISNCHFVHYSSLHHHRWGHFSHPTSHTSPIFYGSNSAVFSPHICMKPHELLHISLGMFASSLLLKSIYLLPMRKLFFTPLSLLLWQKNPRTVTTGQNSSSSNHDNIQTVIHYKEHWLHQQDSHNHLWENKETHLTLPSMCTPLIVEKATLHVTDNISLWNTHCNLSHKALGKTVPGTCSALYKELKIGLLICLTTVTICTFVNYFHFHDQHFI